MKFFSIYLLVYCSIAFTYLWYRYIAIMFYEEKNQGKYKGKVSVIIPFYNEKVSLLKRTIQSVYNCKGEKEIIVIDDGSTDLQCYKSIKKIQKKLGFELIRYEENKGKRYAQCLGFEKAKYDVVMTLDSDTVLDKNALVELIKPFSNSEVGATTGQLEVMNDKVNLLTRLQAARYWNAFNFERRSQSLFGAVVCCSGPISAYRMSFIKSIIGDYREQSFLGKKCTFGDDRHLTTLVLKKGYKVLFVSSAKGLTDAPENLFKFVKQQIRWRKSWIRESILISRFMFKKSLAVSFEVCLNVIITFLSVFARIGIIVGVIANPMYLLVVVPMIAFMGFLHSLFVLFFNRKYFFSSVGYAFFHAFVVYWLVFVAAFTFFDTGWGTR